jgi:anaerobic magnesium-protoporphyrin IX monomethyl ester cyclase
VADVLLTHSYHLPYDPKQVRKMQPYPPLGTLYAASVLRSRGISVAVFDTMLQDPARFSELLERHKPRFVAIYEDDFNFLSKMCLTRMREVACQMTESARCFGATVIVHGSDASDHADEYLRYGANYVLLGEAETALSELCSALFRCADISAIPGLISPGLDGNYQLRNRRAAKPTPWHCLPNPARDLISMGPYRQAWKASHGYFSLNLVASRGCPYRCNWCAKPISGNKFHVRPPDAVAREVRELKEVYGAEHLWFGDDTFALDHRWTQQFAYEMEKRRCALPFKIQARADLMTLETVDALKRAGCAEVWMGVESGSQKILDAMDKGLRVDEIALARELLEEAGIRACYFLQFGYPGESWREIQQTISLVRTTRPDDIGVSVSYPLPNTKFYEKVRAELGRKRNWADSDDLCVMFKAAYTDEFYRALRDSLHAEVDSWHTTGSAAPEFDRVTTLWQRVVELEPLTRNGDATSFSFEDTCHFKPAEPQLVPLQTLSHAAREV